MGEERNESGKSIIKTGIIIIIIGVMLLLIIMWAMERFPVLTTDSTCNLWVGFFNDLAKTVITIGGGTVLYSYFDFVNYIRKILTSIVVDYQYLDQLSVDKKKEIIHRLEKQVIYGGLVSDENTLYDFVNKEVQNLVKSVYYESMTLNVNCRIIDGDIIEKNIIREFDCNFSAQEEYKIDLALMTKCSFVKDDNIPTPFVIEEMTINGKDMMDRIKRYSTDKDGAENSVDTYNTTICYDFVNESDKIAKKYIDIGAKCVVKIYMRYKTLVPFSDNNMGFRVYVPCQNFNAILVYDEDMIDVFADIFAFKDREVNERKLDKSRITYRKNKNCIDILFKDWILPGDGIMYIFNKKKN